MICVIYDCCDFATKQTQPPSLHPPLSAAVLQANESGALVRVLQDGRMKYVRSRRMPSMGFDPILNMSQLMTERERLLQESPRLYCFILCYHVFNMKTR